MKPISHEKDENDSYGIMTCSIMVFSVLTFGLILFLLICRIIHCLFSKCDTVFFSDDNLLFIIFDVIVKATGFRHIAMYLASDYGFVSNIAFIFMAFSLLALVTIYFFFKNINYFLITTSILIPIWLFCAMLYRGSSPLNIPQYGTGIQKQSMKHCLSFYSSDEITVETFPVIMANCEDNAVKKRKWEEEAQVKIQQQAAEAAKAEVKAKESESLRKAIRELK